MKIGDVIRKALSEGKDTKTILAEVKAVHPDAKTTSASVAWYKAQMKKGATASEDKAPSKPVVKAAAKAIQKIMSKGPSTYSVGGFKSTQGMEGPGFIINLLRDGKKVATASDFGDGGPVHWDWLDQSNQVKVTAVDYKDEPHDYRGTFEENLFWAHCLALPKYVNSFDAEGGTHFITPDIQIEEMVNNLNLTKQLNRLTSKAIAYVYEDDRIYTVKLHPDESEAAAIVRVSADPAVKCVFNKMPIDEALAELKRIQRA